MRPLGDVVVIMPPLTSTEAELDPRRVLDSIGAGSAASWSLANLAPRMLAGDFAPGFYIKHFVKDMGIALQEARRETEAEAGALREAWRQLLAARVKDG